MKKILCLLLVLLLTACVFAGCDSGDYDYDGYYYGNNGGGGGTTITSPKSNSSKSCTYCGGRGKVTCTTCGGKGYYEIRTNTPAYGGLGTGGTHYEKKSCTSIYCKNGVRECKYCNGTGRK